MTAARAPSPAVRLLAWLLALSSVAGFALGVAVFVARFRKPPTDVVSWPHALLVDALLLLLFTLQHSGMAHARYKAWLLRRVHPLLERPIYAAASGGVFLALLAGWAFPPGMLLDLTGSDAQWAFHVPAMLSALLVLRALHETGAADLAGIRDAWSGVPFAERPGRPLHVGGLYRWFRHPLLLGTILCFWCWHVLSMGRVLLALAVTGYIAWAVPREERALLAHFGEPYADYCRRVRRWPLVGRRGPPA